MIQKKILFFTCLHVFIGIAIVVFHGPSYGDSQNFYSYAESIDSIFEFINWTDITSMYNYNVLFVSLVYKNILQALIINLFCLFAFLRLSNPKNILINKRLLIPGINIRQYYLVIFFILLCPSIFARLGEPSREYLQSLILFLLGLYFQANTRSMKWLLLLFFVFLIRPVALPIYILWITFFWVLKKNILSKAIFFLIIIFSLFYSSDIPIVQMYSEKIGDYHGSLWASPNLYQKILLNIFGDISSFASEKYPEFDRSLFLLDYLWRILFLGLLLFRGRVMAFIFIIFSAAIIAAVYPFPHPRYFVPALFFLGGIICGSQLKNKFTNVKP